MTETLRGLLTGSAIGGNAWVSLAWCTVITLTGYLWSRARFDSTPKR